jgi:hypothetical protein
LLGVVIDSLDGASPLGDRERLANTQGGEGGVDAGLRVGGGRGLPGWRHAIRAAVRFTRPEQGNSKATQSAGGGREVDVMSRQRPKQRRKPARRPWRRPLVGLGLLAGWFAVSKRGRQAVKVAKEQTSKARRKLAGARPARTTTVAPPTDAPPGPVLAEVPNSDGGDETPGPKPDTETETARAEPPTSQ